MKEIITDKKNEGKKLFRFIKSVLPVLKNSDIFKIIRKKTVTLNDKKTDPDYILKSGDNIKIYLKDEYFLKKSKKIKFQSIDSNLVIIYEDADLLVINKPRGTDTHPSKVNYKNNLQESAKAYLYAKGEYNPADFFMPTPCHRLDRNTSGVIIMAKNHNTLKLIAGLFKERKVEKTYFAVIYGEFKKKLLLTSKIEILGNKVDVFNLKAFEKIPEKKIFLSNNPDLSATLVNPLAFANDCSLVSIDLWTGKKHQIRAHLTEFGEPLLGDKKYYNNNSNYLTYKLNIDHYFLHSYKLKVAGYDEWVAPLPENFKEIISKLFKNFEIN